MDTALDMGWDRGLTFTWKRKRDKKPSWEWSYADEFIPILQRTHGLWVLRNALRHARALTSPMEKSPYAD